MTENTETTTELKPDSRFALKVVWLDKDVAIAVDYVISKGTSPLTPYYFWQVTTDRLHEDAQMHFLTELMHVTACLDTTSSLLSM